MYKILYINTVHQGYFREYICKFHPYTSRYLQDTESINHSVNRFVSNISFTKESDFLYEQVIESFIYSIMLINLATIQLTEVLNEALNSFNSFVRTAE